MFKGGTSPSGPCAAGFVCAGGASKSSPSDSLTGFPCPVGFFCTVGTSVPTPCPKGSFRFTFCNKLIEHFIRNTVLTLVISLVMLLSKDLQGFWLGIQADVENILLHDDMTALHYFITSGSAASQIFLLDTDLITWEATEVHSAHHYETLNCLVTWCTGCLPCEH